MKKRLGQKKMDSGDDKDCSEFSPKTILLVLVAHVEQRSGKTVIIKLHILVAGKTNKELPEDISTNRSRLDSH